MPDITILGSINMDLVLRTPHLPMPGETIIGREFTTNPGGKGANQAVAAARLGGDVVFIGRVGHDDFGRTLGIQLTGDHVDTTYVTMDEHAVTGVAVITVEASGQNTIVVASGANANVFRDAVDAGKGALTSSKVLVAQLEVPLDTVTYALELARASHIMTLLNPAPAQPLSDTVLALCDILVPNELEASTLTGIEVVGPESAERAARELGRRSGGIVIITLGDRGAVVWDGGAVFHVPAFGVHAVDATAAGDAFIGALAVEQAHGSDLHTALRIASAAGALAATKYGAQPSLPTRAAVESLLAQSQPEKT